MGPCGETRKALQGPTYGGWGVVARISEVGANTRDCPQVSGVCLIFFLVVQLCPIVEDVKPCLQQGPQNGLGPESMCHEHQSFLQLSLYPHPPSLVSVPSCTLAGGAAVPRLMLGTWNWSPRLELLLGVCARTCASAGPMWLPWKENKQMNRQKHFTRRDLC